MARSLDSRSALVAILSVLAWTQLSAMEIYLRELTVYTSHETSFFSNTPEVYIICDDDRDPLFLRTVIQVNKKYEFEAEQIPATHINEGECVLCSLKEFDLLDEDDLYGKMKLCADDFGSNGISEVKSKGEFKARFECPSCKVKHEAESKEAVTSVAKKRVTVHSTGVEANHAEAVPVVKEKSEPEGVSKMGVVGIGIVVFVVGVVIGAVSVRYISTNHRDREMQRVREMSAYLAQSDIPYDRLPKGAANNTTGTLKVGQTSYHPVPSDETGESSS